MSRHLQTGSFLIEALVAILIFAFGILGLVALAAKAVSTQTDSEYRAIASNLADEMLSTIALGVDRCPNCTVPEDVSTHIRNSLAVYAHHGTGSECPTLVDAANPIDGDASTNADVLNWVNKVTDGTAGLPGATDAGIQIKTANAADLNDQYNPVVITICWQGPKDTAPRRFSTVTYVN